MTLAHPRGLVAPGRPPTADATPPPPVLPVVRWVFYAFIASIAFEIPNRSIPVEVPTLMGAVFLLTTLLQPGVCYERFPWAFWWFLGYLGAFAVSLVVNGLENAQRAFELTLHVIQAGLVFLAASNLMRREELARGALWTLVAATALGAALPFLGIGRTGKIVWTGGERLTAFGQNPNQRALVLTGGLIALLGLAYGPIRQRALVRWSALPFVVLLAVGLVQTGSRGGTLAALAGLTTFAVVAARRSLRTALVMLVAIGGLVLVVTRSDVMRNRLHPTAGMEALAGRERIFPALWQMFEAKPVLGWGPINNQYELASRLNEREFASRDAHNLALELMTSVGVVGSLPFLMGLALCALGAWRARRGPFGVLPMAMLVAQVTANMSSTFLASKLFWTVLGFSIAAGATAGLPAAHPVPIRGPAGRPMPWLHAAGTRRLPRDGG